MRIGIVVDGKSEFQSLPRIYPRIQTSNTFVRTLLADIQPLANPTKIARAVEVPIITLSKKNVNKIIVLLDLENREECAPQWSGELESAIWPVCRKAGINGLHVVLKVRTFENWLLSDLDFLKSKPNLFQVSKADESKISPNKADNANAKAVMSSCARKPYKKTKDSLIIATEFDPYKAGQNSRSFRRFLRVSGCRHYREQSKRPI